MSDVSEHSDSEFYFPKKKKKKEKRGGHMIKCLLTELGRAGREDIWLEVMAYAIWPEVVANGPSAALGPYAMTEGQIFSRPPFYSVNKYIV